MKNVKSLRLLPAVIAVAVVLFGLKLAGLAFSAGAAEAAKPDTKVAALPDPAASIKSALPNPNAKPQPQADTPADPNAVPGLPADIAGTGLSTAEVDVLSSLAGRRDALDERAHALETREKLLDAAEARVDSKIADLKIIQDTIEDLLGQRDQKENEQLDTLVKIYTAMKPKDAARIFGSLDENVRMAVAGRMKADVLAGVLAGMPDAQAQKLTLQLANRYKLPEPTANAAAAAVATPPPAPAASATPQADAPTADAGTAPAAAPTTPVQTQAAAPVGATQAPAKPAPAPSAAANVPKQPSPQPQAAATPATTSPATAQAVPAAQPKSGG